MVYGLDFNIAYIDRRCALMSMDGLEMPVASSMKWR